MLSSSTTRYYHHHQYLCRWIITILICCHFCEESESAFSSSFVLPRPKVPLLSVLSASVAPSSSFSSLSPSPSPIGNKKPFLLSDRIILVGNLDWEVSPDYISKVLLGAVYDVNDDNGDNAMVGTTVKVKELVKKNRKRDLNKLHSGSATVSFETVDEAVSGMEALRRFSDFSSTLDNRDGDNIVSIIGGGGDGLTLRWASVIVVEPPRISLIVSEERILLRRARADAYARRRQRVAARTDDIIRSILPLWQNHNDDDPILPLRQQTPQYQLENLTAVTPPTIPVLDAPVLDWSECPVTVDPTGGGGLNADSERGRRKKAAVEAFLLVVQDALLLDDFDGHNRMKADDSSRGDGCITTDDRRIVTVADLGCGAGNLAIPLAYWLQKGTKKKPGVREIIKVLGVDLNSIALDRLSDRSLVAGVNVETLHENLYHLLGSSPDRKPDEEGDKDKEELGGNNDKIVSLLSHCAAVVSLHACGSASDLAMDIAIENSIPFAVSPCCIGKVNTFPSAQSSSLNDHEINVSGYSGRHMPALDESSSPSSEKINCVIASKISYPRSEWLKNALAKEGSVVEDYRLLAAAADYAGDGTETQERGGGSDDRQETIRRERCRVSKVMIETDRLEHARECGYHVRMLELPRIGPFYAKREIVLGALKGSAAAVGISQLPTLM